MRTLIPLLLIVAVLSPAVALATDVQGDVWGTWTKENSPYNVIGYIRVPPGMTLVIEPGVVVNFRVHHVFSIRLATLVAVGTETDSIYFTAEDSATGWRGIRFQSSSNNCRLSYCRLEYGRATGGGEYSRGGVIYCFNSSPMISNNTIIDNLAYLGGGAIYCAYSSPTISSNTISNNTSRDARGGGIHCWASDPMIANNLICNNSALSYGGGVYCGNWSDPTVTGNIISGNFAGINGGGVECREHSSPLIHENVITANSSAQCGGGVASWETANPTITNNVISRNSAPLAAGGIYLLNGAPLVDGNVVCGNSTEEVGGGIYCGAYVNSMISHNIIVGNSAGGEGGGLWIGNLSNPTVSYNTISGNVAGYVGGGVYCKSYSDPTITGTILWGDEALVGPEIGVDPTSQPTVSYCDVQGGWPGIGNFDADPLFVGPEREDFHLRWHSPCIDAGDPNFPLDPDGTRSDIGALYFNQDVAGIIEVYPHNTPIIVPPWGKCIFYDLRAFNFSNHTLTVDVRSYFYSPEIGRSRWLDKYSNISIPVGDSVGRIQIRHRFPDHAPPGDYTFVAYIGDFPNNIVDSCLFYLTKVDSTGAGTTDCLEGEDLFKEISATESSLPNDYALSRNYPNPFNATTNINYQLPVNSRVRLQVYNLLGQKVATLVEERQEAGYRSVIWEASEHSSGLYFYKLTAGDFTETKRMMLVK